MEIGSLYEEMEAAVMQEILTDLEDELIHVYMRAAAERLHPKQTEMLWHVVATPAMMKELACHVASAPAIASC